MKASVDIQSLSPILPNVQSLPLHVQTAKADILDFLRRELGNSSSTTKEQLDQAVSRLEERITTHPAPADPQPSRPPPPHNQPQHMNDYSQMMRDQMLSFFLASQSISPAVMPTPTNAPPSSPQLPIAFENVESIDFDFSIPNRSRAFDHHRHDTRATRTRRVDRSRICEVHAAVRPSLTSTSTSTSSNATDDREWRPPTKRTPFGTKKTQVNSSTDFDISVGLSSF